MKDSPFILTDLLRESIAIQQARMAKDAEEEYQRKLDGWYGYPKHTHSVYYEMAERMAGYQKLK